MWGAVISANPALSPLCHYIASGVTTSNIDCLPVDCETMIDQIDLVSDLKEVAQS